MIGATTPSKNSPPRIRLQRGRPRVVEAVGIAADDADNCTSFGERVSSSSATART